MSRLARVMVRLSTARPRLTIVLCLALAAAAVVCARRGLTFETSSLRLLPQQRVYVQQFERFLEEFGELNDIVIVVESEHPDAAKDFAARLAAVLTEPPLRAERVTFRVDPDRFAGRALLYLPMERLEELRDSVIRHRQFIEDYAAQPTLARLIGAVDHEIVRTFAGRFIDLGLEETTTVDASFVERLLASIDDRLAAPGSRPSPWTAVFTGAQDERSGYFTSSDGRLLFVLVEPRREAGNFTDNKEVIASIRRTIAGLRAEFPDVAAGVTGTPALSNDEMLTAFRDSTVATAVACVVVLAVVLLAFRQIKKPLVMLFALLVSLAWSLGLIALTVGHLTVFSVMFISLFIGLGVDYGIYLLFRYEEERGDGHDPATALRITADRAGPGILFAALSAAGSFGVLMLTEFRGIVEFGFIGALSILMALVAMLTLFPALLLVLDRRRARIRLLTPTSRAHPSVSILERIAQYQRPVLALTAVLTAFSLWAVAGVGFDYNRLNLQAKGTESVTWETKIMAAGRSAFPALSAARSLDELRTRQEALARLATVSDVVSVLSAIPKEQAPKIALLRDLAPTVGAVRVGAGSSADPHTLRAALAGLRRRLALAIREAGDAGPSATLVAADGRAADIVERLAHPDAETRQRLDAIQEEFRRDFDAKLRRFRANLAPTPVTVNDLPDEIRRKFVGRSGTLLLQISPAVNIWTREGMQQFVDEVRTVDAAVTGSPVISYEASRMMERAYFEGTFYAVLLVLALAGVMLRRASDTLLAVVPMVLGTLWMVGFMKAAGLSFNLANVWALPLVIGAAAEYGLNVALRHREALEHGGPSLARSTVMAVALNGMTTIVGFGSLLLAHHQGMFGLGLLLTAGTVAGLAASLLILPALLYRFGYVPARPAKDTRRLAEAVVSRRRLSIILVALALLAAPGRPPAAAAADEPAERVRATVDQLYRLASPPPRTASERRERDGAAARVMDRLFDWSAMARQTLGKHWEARTAAEREEFTRLFAELFRHAYVSRISLVEASGFKYGASAIAGGRATVNTQVTTRRGSVIGVTYALAREGGQDWRVHDVLVEGISLLDNYRTQFASIIARSSYETLVDRLRSRVREHG